MIKINRIQPPLIQVFDPEGNSLGLLNEYEFTDLRAQIAENQIEGYCFEYEGNKISMNRNAQYHERIFTSMIKNIKRIIKAQKY